jgi:hypothetical protein
MTLGIFLGPVACDAGFDRAAWAAERDNRTGESRRAAMVRDLDKAGVHRGASRGLVAGLLGTPDATNPERDLWYLGRSATGPSFEALEVSYRSDGRVERVVVTRD